MVKRTISNLTVIKTEKAFEFVVKKSKFVNHSVHV